MFSLIRLNHSVLGCTILLVTDHKQIRDIGDRIVRYTKAGLTFHVMWKSPPKT
ncbi:MAG: hypothetical protein V7K97_25580 [Nostoc sp.]|uniref:hypothetical protein n=1 Tax=Nostoc sp. TaxID=1180 RepID=UPI002FF4732C